MAILKLKEPGDELVMVDVAAETIEGQYGKQVKFDAPNGDTLYVPLASVERQLDRVGVAEIDDLSGMSIHFSRSGGKNGVVYWNLNRATAEEVKSGVSKPKTNGRKEKVEMATPALLPNEDGSEEYLKGEDKPEVKTGFAALAEKYDECMGHIVKEIVPALANRGITADAVAISSMTSTLFIARRQEKV